MDVPRERMVDEILEFVASHPESNASLAVSRHILGDEPRGDDFLAEMKRRIGQVDDEVIEACYFIIK
ncbi:MAG TPA: hypothetical protein VIL95_06570 [Bacillota bacterium]